MGTKPLNIGALAEAVGVGRETIRFYERRGLIPDPPRSTAGYREYSYETVQRVRFIKRAQELGFTLAEISELLELRIRDPSVCGVAARNARTKLAQAEAKIEDLDRIGAALRRLVEQCGAQEATGDCPILEQLDAE
ncbi:MAG: MerR family transcriptional regulator [Gemmatimonadota bacterium]|nr:MerR family transcriptional regulator [Gemmatimonadota bacterium]